MKVWYAKAEPKKFYRDDGSESYLVVCLTEDFEGNIEDSDLSRFTQKFGYTAI